MLNFCKVTGTTIKTYSVTERGTSNLYVYNSKYWYGVNKDGTKQQYTMYPVGSTFGNGTNRVHIVGSDNKEYFIDRLIYKSYNGFTMAVDDNSGVKNGCHRPIIFVATMTCNSPKSNANSSLPALRALSAIIFIVIILVVVAKNVYARRKEAKR